MSYSIDFLNSVDEWFRITSFNHPKQKLLLSKKILGLLYDELKIEEIIPHINSIIIMAKNNHSLIETAFNSIMTKMRNTIAPSSFRVYCSVGRSVLENMGLNKESLLIIPNTEKERMKTQLPLKIANSNNENLTRFINERIDFIRSYSRIRSEITIKNMVGYWKTVILLFGDLETINPYTINMSVDNVVSKLQQTNPTDHQIIDTYHLFDSINDDWKSITMKQFRKKFIIIKNANHVNDDTDKDRLSSKQQEDIWNECRTSFEKLIIGLLFTTGLRVGGLCSIKREDVVSINDNNIIPKKYGKTTEKGDKIRTFPIFDMCVNSLINWVKETHIYRDNPYLFPSKTKNGCHLTTNTIQKKFKEIAKRAGYSGPEIHVHSSRHSVAFNLLESGNKMDEIGKFLGHSNPMTTAKFYAKMNMMETIDRMDTSCIGGEDKKKKHVKDVPKFKTEGKRKRKNPLSSLKNVVINID